MHTLALVGDDPDTGGYLATFAVDPRAGQFHELDRIPLSARALHLRAGGSDLWACLVDDTVVQVPVHTDGRLGAPASTPVEGLPCHSEAVGSSVVISLYRAGSLAVLEPGVRPRYWSLPREAGSTSPPRAHQSLLDPAGRYLLVCDIGSGAILSLDAATLDPVARHEMPADRGPRNLVFAPGDPGHVFVTGQDDSTITELAYDQESGVLTHRATVASGAFPAAIAAGSAAVYQAGRAAGTVAMMRTGTSTLAVRELPAGTWPIDLRLHNMDTREWLAVANRDSGELVIHSLDKQGSPTGEELRLGALGVSSISFL